MNRNLTCLSLAFGLLLATGSMAHAKSFTIQNCAPGVRIDVQIFNAGDAVMAVPASAATGLTHGQKAQLQCMSGNSCKYHIAYHLPPSAAPTQLGGTFGAGNGPNITGTISLHGPNLHAFRYHATSRQAALNNASC